MIRAQARADHQAATGHSGYRGTTDETGRIVCTQCPWEYPPAPEPVTDADVEAAIAEPPGGQADRIEALVRAANIRAEHEHDSACDDGSRYCPTRDYEANPIVEIASADLDRSADQLDPTADDDPGPEPDDAPDAPPLTLRDRIANVIEHANISYAGQDGDQAEFDQLVDAVHTAVGAGADWTPRTEGTAM
jgi:hypothetical protein